MIREQDILQFKALLAIVSLMILCFTFVFSEHMNNLSDKISEANKIAKNEITCTIEK